MSDRRSSLDFYQPAEAATLPRSTWTPPPPAPSFWETAKASFRTAIDEQGLPQELRLEDAYRPIAAELERQGIPRRRLIRPDSMPGGKVAATGGQLDHDAVWAQVERARERDPKAFPGVPKTRELFEAQTLSRDGGRAADQATLARGGLIAQLTGGIPAAFADPFNLATLPIGAGPGASLAKRVVIEALTNAGVELAELPDTIRNRARMGEDTTAGEAAARVGTALVAGAVLPAAITGGVKTIELAQPVARRLADAVRARIGTDNLTAEEAAAVRSLDREADTLATSPFAPGAGSAEHLARIDAAEAALLEATPAEGASAAAAVNRALYGPSGRPPARPAPAPGAFDQAAYARQVAKVESGDRVDAQAGTSSAFGRYQITKGTWERLAKGDPGLGWYNRANAAAQEQIFTRLTDANRRALTRAGAAETPGNLYLLHFAGEGGGLKILRADPDTPVSALLGADAIAANRSILEGKTAGEVIAWAHGKMGASAPSGPALAREGFESDEALTAAQRQLEIEEAALARAEDASARIEERDPFDPRGWDEELGGMSREDGPALPVRAEEDVAAYWADRRAQGKRRDAVWAVRDADGRMLDWGFTERDARDRAEARGTGGLTVDQLRPGDLRQQPPPLEPARAAATLDQARAAVRELLGRELTNGETGYTANLSRNSLDKMTSQSAVRKSRSPEEHATAVANADALFERATLERSQPDRKGDPNIVAIHRFRTTMLGRDGELAVKMTVKETRGAGEPNPLYTIEAVEVGPGGKAPPDGGIERAPAQAPDAPRTGAQSDVGTPPARVEGFDHPDDVAAAAQIDSLEHDLRMWLGEEEAQGMTMRLTEDGDVVNPADALDELDADEAAIAAARACMVPPGGDA